MGEQGGFLRGGKRGGVGGTCSFFSAAHALTWCCCCAIAGLPKGQRVSAEGRRTRGRLYHCAAVRLTAYDAPQQGVEDSAGNRKLAVRPPIIASFPLTRLSVARTLSPVHPTRVVERTECARTPQGLPARYRKEKAGGSLRRVTGCARTIEGCPPAVLAAWRSLPVVFDSL